jgi:3'(2'), 5'-bisphosphate nucleotidase
MMYEAELEAAKRLAREAGEVILEFYAKEIIAEEKLGVDSFYEPVTEADREASRIIVRGLTEAFPGDGVLSEEERDDPDIRLSRKRAWIVDPIDGTAGFVQKDGDFAVQIGLAEAGEAVAGLVFLPVHEQLYYAARGHGAFVESRGRTERLVVSRRAEFPKMMLAVTRHHWSRKMNRVIKDFGFRRLCRRGSVGLKIGLLAEGTCDIYIHLSPRTKLWDTCAPQIILEEAGGRLTDIFGSPIRYDIEDLQNHNGILASNGIAHDEALKKLRPLLAEFGRVRVTPGRKSTSSRSA